MSGRGGFVHEQVILDRLEQTARRSGATALREVSVARARTVVPLVSRSGDRSRSMWGGRFEGHTGRNSTDHSGGVTGGTSGGHVDLIISRDGNIIAVEAELSPRRVIRDLRKAAEVGARELWIVVPVRRTAVAVERRLSGMGVAVKGGGILVLTLGQALQRIEHSFPFSSGAHVKEKTNQDSQTDAPPW